MERILCPACGKLQTFARAIFTGEAVCGGCGAKTPLATLTRHRCSLCGDSIIAPAGSRVPVCPCHSPDATAAPPQQLTKPQALRCRKCSAKLPCSGDGYGACPVCGWQPDEQYIGQQTYFASGLEPITLQWRPAPGEMLCIHLHSGYIPPDSLLIVDPGQQAAYFSGGQLVLLEESTYALFDADRDIGEVARAIRADQMTVPPLGLKMNTRVIFFDSRIHPVGAVVTCGVSDSPWQLRLPLTLSVQLTDATALLSNALPYENSLAASEYLRKRAAAAAVNAVGDVLAAIPPQVMHRCETPMQVRHAARLALSDAQGEILRHICNRLSMSGMAATDVEFAFEQASCCKVAM